MITLAFTICSKGVERLIFNLLREQSHSMWWRDNAHSAKKRELYDRRVKMLNNRIAQYVFLNDINLNHHNISWWTVSSRLNYAFVMELTNPIGDTRTEATKLMDLIGEIQQLIHSTTDQDVKVGGSKMLKDIGKTFYSLYGEQKSE